ncbi:CPBP family intramembrane glutamic endopeptidase [Pedobacter sp.]|uniref:CPBP family intramembrane glutamic endopeptidase n=1 Tax=Pedobacter sp. TaxID=1411316 RepID=UPI003D7FC5ED
MNFLYPEKPERSAYLQLLILVSYALAGITICSIIGIFILYGWYGSVLWTDQAALASGDPKYINGLKVLQILTTVGLFLLPPLFLALTERIKIKVFYGFKKPQLPLLGLVLLLMLCSMPFMEWTALWNQQMHLPDFLKPVELWMKAKEEEAMRMTLLLLTMKGFGDFLLNLFMIALLPAIAEELMFRGGVQRSFTRMFGNPHVAIWLSAFIFSAIHMQFYGFLPRLLLGAGFGYIYLWSGSLWYAMLAHFLNNGFAVCMAWYLQIKNLPLNEAEQTFHFQWYGYVLSLLLSIFIFWKFKQQSTYGKQLG